MASISYLSIFLLLLCINLATGVAVEVFVDDSVSPTSRFWYFFTSALLASAVGLVFTIPV